MLLWLYKTPNSLFEIECIIVSEYLQKGCKQAHINLASG